MFAANYTTGIQRCLMGCLVNFATEQLHIVSQVADCQLEISANLVELILTNVRQYIFLNVVNVLAKRSYICAILYAPLHVK